MNKHLKRIISWVICAVVFIAFLLSVCVYREMKTLYYQRCVECNPNELFKTLELGDPNNITELYVAKSRRIDSVATYLIKFNMASKLFEEYIESIDGEVSFTGDYDVNFDYRDTPFGPKWFTTPISNGKYGDLWWPRSLCFIYIDTSNKDYNIVYLKGHY